jgi:acetyl-CoA carboxylase carboxyl transferase subunit beta
MNWLTNYVRPKLRQLVRRTEVPDNLWSQCPACAAMIFHRDLAASQHVCPHCGHHMRIGPDERLGQLFDEGSWQKIELPDVPVDPLRFRDRRRYTDRLKEAQSASGNKDAIVVAHGTMGGMPTVMAVFDFAFLGGSMGVAVGEGLIAASRLAELQRAALITVPASGGARMQEGILSLMQMPRTTAAVAQVKEAGLPYLVVLTDPTTGGVSASFAMLGDVAIAETGAAVGFAGQRVIRETIRETLPEGFQRAEYLLEHGMIDIVVHRSELRATIIRVLDMLTRPARAAEVVEVASDQIAIPDEPTAAAGDETAAPQEERHEAADGGDTVPDAPDRPDGDSGPEQR